jgi:hypothetical protein
LKAAFNSGTSEQPLRHDCLGALRSAAGPHFCSIPG